MAVQGEILAKAEKYVAKDITPVKREISDIKDNETRIQAMREYDSVPVRGVFRRHDGNTDPLEFSFLKYKGDKLQKYKLSHGQVHTIPRGVAVHLNDDCKTPVYGSLPGIAAHDASRDAHVIGYQNRFSFSSLDFSNRVEENHATLIKPVTQIAM